MNDRCYQQDLMSVEDAIDTMLSQTPIPDETIAIATIDSLGHVLAEPVTSGIDVPGYDNSAMDGYAVRMEDVTGRDIELPVSQRIPAGSVSQPLEPGTAARIFTGAQVPDDADAVVMQECCQETDGIVRIDDDIRSGQNIRRAGEDIRKGAVILEQGRKIRPQEQGLLASIGIAEVVVYRKLKVATFFTGDELVEPGGTLADGQIYNSNRYTLRGLLQSRNCEIIDLGIVPDSLEATRAVMKQAAEQADLIITSGGVSVGEEDYVRIALEELGELSMWRIAMKPGKPVAFGKVGDSLFIGLPGNPVSVFVTFHLFARPLLSRMQGISGDVVDRQKLPAGFDWRAGKRQEYLRARIETVDGERRVMIYPHQGSGVLSSASWADGLVEVMIGEDIAIGGLVDYISFNELMA